ncbi:MAG: aminopeptidase P family protein, partial [Pseudomonadota bacterium]
DALRPGQPMGAVFAAHADVFARHGLSAARLNACGYALGARFAPSWMEHQMFYEDAPTVMAPGQVYFLHMILMDSETGAAMTLGRTSLIEATGASPLSHLPLDLISQG